MRYLRIAVVAAVAFCSAAAFRQISWYPPEDVLVIWVRGTPEQTAIYRESLEDYLARHPDACWRSPYSCCASAGSLAASSSVR